MFTIVAQVSGLRNKILQAGMPAPQAQNPRLINFADKKPRKSGKMEL